MDPSFSTQSIGRQFSRIQHPDRIYTYSINIQTTDVVCGQSFANICEELEIHVDSETILRQRYIEEVQRLYGVSSGVEEDRFIASNLEWYPIVKIALSVSKDGSTPHSAEWELWRQEITYLSYHSHSISLRSLLTTRPDCRDHHSIDHLLSQVDPIELMKYAKSIISLLSTINLLASIVRLSVDEKIESDAPVLKDSGDVLYLTRFAKKWCNIVPLINASKLHRFTFKTDDLMSHNLHAAALANAYLNGESINPLMRRIEQKGVEIAKIIASMDIPPAIGIVTLAKTIDEEKVFEASAETWKAFRFLIDQFKDARSQATRDACGPLNVWSLILTELDVLAHQPDHIGLYDALLADSSTVEYNRSFATFVDSYPTIWSLLTIKGTKGVKKIEKGLGKINEALLESEYGYIASFDAALAYFKYCSRNSYEFYYMKKNKGYSMYMLNTLYDSDWNWRWTDTLNICGQDGLRAILYHISNLNNLSAIIEKLLSLYRCETSIDIKPQLVKTLRPIVRTYSLGVFVKTITKRLVQTFHQSTDLTKAVQWWIDILNECFRDTDEPLYSITNIQYAFFRFLLSSPQSITIQAAKTLTASKWTVKARLFYTAIRSDDLSRIDVLLQTNIDQKRREQIYHFAFRQSALVLSFLLSRVPYTMKSIPKGPYSQKELISLQILLSHPSTDPVIRNNQELLSLI